MRGNGFFLLVAAVIVLAIVGSVAYGIFEHTNTKTVTFVVQDKQAPVKCDSDGTNCHSHYLIFTNKGVYEDTDSFWFFKFRSSDLYGQLQRGHRYTCKVYGFRIGFTSTYPNIISCKGA